MICKVKDCIVSIAPRARTAAALVVGSVLCTVAHAEVPTEFSTPVTDATTFWASIKVLALSITVFVILRKLLRKAT